ncbi:MAG: SRPBCC domain-containing protein [Ectothiorhodospiraceae bacterium AqS1]|nr:SRPBCC domain-containing protein [Ectothiorhodospiraceae bacterium AqS1]
MPSIVSSKAVKGLLSVALIASIALISAAIFTEKTFYVERVIEAPPDRIWRILMDTRGYRDWNPVFVSIDGSYEEGARLTNSVRFPDASIVTMEARVRALIAEKEIRQSGGTPGLLSFDHRWLLEPVDGGTLVSMHEVDRGIWLWFWDSSWILPAYESVLDALERRIEEQT